MIWNRPSYNELLIRQYRPAFQRGMGPVSDDMIQRAIKRLCFRGAVPDDVVDRFTTVQDILRWSEERPKRIRVAYEFAINTFELALKLRYRQLQGDVKPLHVRAPNEPRGLQPLVDWHAARNHFEAPVRYLIPLLSCATQRCIQVATTTAGCARWSLSFLLQEKLTISTKIHRTEEAASVNGNGWIVGYQMSPMGALFLRSVWLVN